MTEERKALQQAWLNRRDNPLLHANAPSRRGWWGRAVEMLHLGIAILGVLVGVAAISLRGSPDMYWVDNFLGATVGLLWLILPAFWLASFPRPLDTERLRELRLSLLTDQEIMLGVLYWPLRLLLLLSIGLASMAAKGTGNDVGLVGGWILAFFATLTYGIMVLHAALMRSGLRWGGAILFPFIGLSLATGLFAPTQITDRFEWLSPALLSGLLALYCRARIGSWLLHGGPDFFREADAERYLRSAWWMFWLKGFDKSVNPALLASLVPIAGLHAIVSAVTVGLGFAVAGLIDELSDPEVAVLVALGATVPLRAWITMRWARFLGFRFAIRGGVFLRGMVYLSLPLLAIEVAAIFLSGAFGGYVDEGAFWLAMAFVGVLMYPAQLAGMAAGVAATHTRSVLLVVGLIPLLGILPPFVNDDLFLVLSSISWTMGLGVLWLPIALGWCHRACYRDVPFGSLEPGPGPVVPEEIVDRYALRGG